MQSRTIVILVVVVMLALAAFFAMPSVNIPRSVFLVIAALAAVGILYVLFRASSGGDSQSKPRTAQALANELGYDYTRKPDKSFRDRFLHLPEINKRGENKHAIWGDLEGRQITFFNNSYIIPAGQAMIPVMHCVFACEAPDWPTLIVGPRSTWSKLLSRVIRPKGIILENQAFNETFHVKCTDEDFAVTLLSPEVQKFMLEKPTGMKWRIGSEMACMIYKGTLKLERVPASLERMCRFWSLVPPELEHWQG